MGAKARGPRYRRDGFTPEKKRRWLDSYEKWKTIADACFEAGISDTSFYRHYNKWPDFRRAVDAATDRIVVPLENTAWQRATVGGEEKLYRNGELVQVKVKPSDSMLRLLLQARHPKKYGRLSRGGATRKQIEKRLRKQIEAEIRDRIAAEQPSMEEVQDEVIRRIRAIRDHRQREAGAGGGGEDGGEG